MDPAAVTRLSDLPAPGAGTDAERRAARALEKELRAAGRAVEDEPIWVRPQWALVLALHVALLVVGSLLAVDTPVAGLAVVAVVLVSLVLDLTGRLFLLRRLTPARATQNVVSAPSGPERPVLLVIAAGYDAPRGGFAYRPGIQRSWASLARRAGGRLPGPLAWPVIAGLAVLGIAIARTAGADGLALDVVQLLATVVLLVAVALLVDIALSDHGPGAGEAAGAGVALALARDLGDAPLRALDVEVVLAGAATGPALGMRAYLRARRDWPRQETIVLALGPCGSGPVGWAEAEGPLVALRFHPRLRELATQVADEESHLRAAPFVARGLPSCAYPARVRGFPALLVRSRPEEPVAPERDTTEAIDPAAARDAIDFCLALVTKVDRDVAARYGAS